MNELNIYQLIGEIIENCQCIEHDLKIIYAIAKPGDFNYNLEDTKKWNLGEIIAKIEELDHKNIFPLTIKIMNYLIQLEMKETLFAMNVFKAMNI